MRAARFLRLWLQSLVTGDSTVSTALKLSAIALAVMGARWFDQPAYLYLWLPVWADLARGYSLTYGWALFAVTAVLYGSWMGGHAWVRSGGPVLRVRDDLITDTEVEVLRLQVSNVGDGVLIPRATLLWIDVDGAPDHAAWMPLEMRWTHFPPGTRPQLSWTEEASADICQYQPRGELSERILFAGEFHVPHVLLRPQPARLARVSFCVRVTVPGTRQFFERAFRLEPDDASPLRYRPVRLRNREANSCLVRLLRACKATYMPSGRWGAK